MSMLVLVLGQVDFIQKLPSWVQIGKSLHLASSISFGMSWQFIASVLKLSYISNV